MLLMRFSNRSMPQMHCYLKFLSAPNQNPGTTLLYHISRNDGDISGYCWLLLSCFVLLIVLEILSYLDSHEIILQNLNAYVQTTLTSPNHTRPLYIFESSCFRQLWWWLVSMETCCCSLSSTCTGYLVSSPYRNPPLLNMSDRCITLCFQLCCSRMKIISSKHQDVTKRKAT